jgi:mRNA-degrading endonuclease RelE of RelBE toxin-antitoxin system
MNFEVLQSVEFEKEAKYLSKKYPSFKYDLKELADSLSLKPSQGSSLGNNCYKVRMSISSKAKGKRGGARVITYVVIHELSVLLLGVYDKSTKETMSDKEIVDRLKNYL